MTGKPGRDSTARARELGAELRRIRERAELPANELARMLGWSPSKVSRLESGKRGASEVDVAVYLVSCGLVVRSELERLVNLAREADSRYWLRPLSPRLPGQLHSLIMQEGSASVITSYEPMIVPGLLQIEEYMRELFRWGTELTAAEVEVRVHARLARQHILRGDKGPRCTFYVHERALLTVVGSAQIMHAQVMNLLLADSRPQCSVRVVRDATGPMGALGGMFMLFNYAGDPPVAYAEVRTAALFMEEPEDVTEYYEVVRLLDKHSLDGGQSREWLAQLASRYSRAEAATHGRARQP